ncbi:hypothetical protein LOC72_10855 [Roseiconus lacunae]|nr:hypothetical protein [Roseiconus lacunae]
MMMPFYGGVMQAGMYGQRNESADRNRSCDVERTEKRLDQLEEDFRELTSQVDEIVNSVDRNTFVLEKIVETLDKNNLLTGAPAASAPVAPAPVASGP